MLKPPQAIFWIHVTMIALLHVLLIAPPFCPNLLDFSSIDPSASTDVFSLTESDRPNNHVCGIKHFYLFKKKNPD